MKLPVAFQFLRSHDLFFVPRPELGVGVPAAEVLDHVGLAGRDVHHVQRRDAITDVGIGVVAEEVRRFDHVGVSVVNQRFSGTYGMDRC